MASTTLSAAHTLERDAADRAMSLVAERLEAIGSAPWTGQQVDPLTRQLVDLLLVASIEVPDERVWPIFDGDHVVGLGHGTSGIMLTLHRAAAILDHRTEEIDAVIEATVTYEDATFDREVGNWRDDRVVDDREPWNCWCHGAAGTRFVRQRLLMARRGLYFFLAGESLEE